MAGIFGDGQRGGIFGAKVDPRLQAELERRAAQKRQEMAGPGFLDQWHNSLANRVLSAPSKLFGGLVVDPAMDLATLAGDVIHGRQPTMAADPQTGEFHTDPRLADRAMNAAGMLTLGAGAVPAEANSLRMGIKAYHGSPHDFERFDSSKIGTGEGAQAYGHGLYFAESPEVADVYKEMLTTKHNPADQQMRRFLTSADENAPGEVLPEGTDFGSILGAGEERASISNTELMKRSLANLERVKQGKGPLHAKALQRAQATVDYLKNNPQARFSGAPYQGRMYEVDIAADPEHFLDFDAPIEAQPPQAQDLLQSLHKYTVKQDGKQWLVLHPGGWVPNAAKNFYRSEEAATKAAEQLNQGRSVQDLVPRTPEQVAPFREAGIPGIRYLDQGSRTKPLKDIKREFLEELPQDADMEEVSGLFGTGKFSPKNEALLKALKADDWLGFDYPSQAISAALSGKLHNWDPSPALVKAVADAQDMAGATRNYVVFDDKLISILKKYGLPISAAGLAALSQLHPQEAQAAQKKQKGR